MKITFLIHAGKIKIFSGKWIVFLLWAVAFCTYAQQQPVRLAGQNLTLKAAFKQIEQQTGMSVDYDARILDTSRPAPRVPDLATVEEVMKVLLRGSGCTFVINKTHIMISREPVAEKKKTVTGKVTDEKGVPVIGANVLEKGTLNGSITDMDGNFSLEVGEKAVLQISYVGYNAEEVPVGNKSQFLIKIREDTQALDEVVVIGYGSAKKRDLTGAVSSIKADKLSAQAPRNVQDILRSNAAGLNIGIATDAKAEASLSIRGKGTLATSSDPLIVLDGVIYEGALADIIPEDIANVDILKDASSAAVYGAKAANGVIVITTKKGKTGKPVINIHATVSLAQSASQPKILDAPGFLRFRQDYNEGRNSEAYLDTYPQIFTNPFELDGVSQLDWYNYDQKTPVSSVTDQQLTTQWLSRLNLTTPEIENYFAGKLTKWDDLVFHNAFQQNYTVSVSNATERTSQYFSLNWTDREGIIVGDRYQNFRARVNIESEVTSFLKIGLNSQFSSRNEGFLRCSWEQMTMISSYGSNNIDDPESLYQRRPTGLDPINPFYDNQFIDRKDLYQNLNAKLYATVQLPFDIEYVVNFTPYYSWREYYNHNSSKGEPWHAIGGESIREVSKRFNWQIDNILRWKRQFAEIHNVELTLLANAEKAQYWSTKASAKGYTPNDVLGYHLLQAGSVAAVSSYDSYQTGDALMGRLFYSFRNKYMLTASIRRDGYSAFGKKNPHAVFPAIALAWIFTQEKFLQATGNWLNYAKLRFSWGENGNRDIGQYAALSSMYSSLRPYIDQSGNIYTTSQMYVNTMANYNLKWERTASYNVGLDFSLFQDVLSGSIETYIARTNDLLVNRTLPNITGFSSVTANLGQIQNKGVEISLTARIIKNKDFEWNASGNFSLNRRKINRLYGDMVDVTDQEGNVIGRKETDDETNGWFIGQDPDRIWSYEREGVWQIDEKEQAGIYGCQPGDFKYKDQDNNGIMNNKDKVFQGYRTPRFRWSLRNEWVYKDFSLSAVLYSHWKYYGAFQRAANNYSFPDRTSDYDFPRWTPKTPINDYARIGSKNIGVNWVDKSFIRLENVSLSYQVPVVFSRKFAVQQLHLSLNIQNVAVWSPHWTFWDPESESITPRTFSFGINIIL